jgi:hypothetical protein
MHELKESDKDKLLQYCRWFTHFIQGGIDILDMFSIVMKHGSTIVDMLIAKTAEYGVLKIRIPSMKDPALHMGWHQT